MTALGFGCLSIPQLDLLSMTVIVPLSSPKFPSLFDVETTRFEIEEEIGL
jgi:hypothetical protein